MPSFDLRDRNGELDALAPFKVLAVMSHPFDRVERERMLGLIQGETGVGRKRRQGTIPKAFMEDVGFASSHIAPAGALLLTLLQLHGNGERATLNRAIPLVAAQLPQWQQPDGQWSTRPPLDHIPRSRRKLLAAFRTNRPVAHLWAALIHGQQHDRADIWPGSRETLPTFLSYATAFADMGCDLPWPGRDRRFTLERAEVWSFVLPEALERISRIEALPLPQDPADG